MSRNGSEPIVRAMFRECGERGTVFIIIIIG